MMKKLLSCLLSAAIILSALSGCGTEAPEESAAPTASGAEYDWETGYAAYEPDTVVMRVNGEDVLWDEFFYWLYSTYANGLAGYDLSDPISGEGSMSFGQYAAMNAAGYCLECHVISSKAEELGVTLTDGDREMLEAQIESDIEEYSADGTRAGLFEYLAGLFVTERVYEFINSGMLLQNRLMTFLYGEDGSALSDEDVALTAEQYGFMTVKHILLCTTDDSGEALGEAAASAKREQAEALLSELEAAPEDGREALFDEMMAEYSEDPGLANFPDGYCFTEGTMVTEFEDAAKALEPGGISGIVESSNGYHILLRESLSPDDMVLLSTGDSYTLRYTCAVLRFNADYSDWVESASVEYAGGFESFDAASLFE